MIEIAVKYTLALELSRACLADARANGCAGFAGSRFSFQLMPWNRREGEPQIESVE